jgi:hypothetical protein
MRGILWLALPLTLAAALPAAPAISEFMAANTRTLADSDGQFSDWIELHNPDPAAVNLAGWYLTDDAKDLTRWQLPAITIPPGGYLLVFASDKNRRDPTKELHTNFELDASGEYLGLVMPDGTTIVSQFGPKFSEQLDDISYGATQPSAVGEAPRTGHFRTPTPRSTERRCRNAPAVGACRAFARLGTIHRHRHPHAVRRSGGPAYPLCHGTARGHGRRGARAERRVDRLLRADHPQCVCHCAGVGFLRRRSPAR